VLKTLLSEASGIKVLAPNKEIYDKLKKSGISNVDDIN
jgi:hypothetical protein